ncbi:hypothetical protein Btru_000363 [Bulinus truncatus]|nr:hypothetical protein Btru_000363 [Bulinus truncatus]
MDFGSEYILAEEEDDDMNVSYSDEEEDEDGIAGFECEIMDMDGPEEEDVPVKGERKNITTNTLKVELAKLMEPPDIERSEKDWSKCNNPSCGAFFSEHDQWIKDDKGYNWTCRFCSAVWHLSDNEKEIKNLPDKYDVCYEHAEVSSTGVQHIDDYKIIFVIDNSGSMGRKMQVPVKEGTLKELVSKNPDQSLNSTEKEGMEVSWLQAVQATVIDEIDELSKSDPTRKIGLVTFNDIVTVYNQQTTVDLVGADLENKATSLRLGESNSNLEPISATAEKIKSYLMELKDGGRTALGPALMVALGMVHNSRGSRIIICTDGASNIGFGKLEEAPTKEDEKFYYQATNKAKVAGASVSIISFDTCELKYLERLPRETGGTLETISPTDLAKPIKDELKKKTIATNTIVTFLVHKDLYVNEKNKDVKDKNSENKPCVSPFVGNVTDSGKQSICFEFAFLNPSQQRQQQTTQVQQTQQQTQNSGQGCNSCTPSCQTTPVINTTAPQLPQYPFQIQISYINVEGKVLTRVWTKLCPITKNREVAQKNMNPDTIVTSFVQKSAKEILDQKSKTHQAELKRKAHNFINEAKHHMSNDSIKTSDELCKKLNTLIETLEELAVQGLSDEVSATLSGFAIKA